MLPLLFAMLSDSANTWHNDFGSVRKFYVIKHSLYVGTDSVFISIAQMVSGLGSVSSYSFLFFHIHLLIAERTATNSEWKMC